MSNAAQARRNTNARVGTAVGVSEIKCGYFCKRLYMNAPEQATAPEAEILGGEAGRGGGPHSIAGLHWNSSPSAARVAE